MEKTISDESSGLKYQPEAGFTVLPGLYKIRTASIIKK